MTLSSSGARRRHVRSPRLSPNVREANGWKLHPRTTTRTATRPVRVLLADAHQLLVLSLAFIIESDPTLEVLGTAASPSEALEKMRLAQPDVALVSYFLLFLHPQGEEMVAAVRSELPETKLLVLIATPDPETVAQCIAAGAVGCISRDQPPELLVESVRRAHAGELVYPQRPLVEILAGARSPLSGDGRIPRLIGRREREVLQSIAAGASVEETAERLSISAHTVRTHLKHAMAKLEVHSRLDAVLLAHKLGLIELAG